MTTSTTRAANHARALTAEPRLAPIDTLVRALTRLAPTRRARRTMCASCVWVRIVKPLTVPLVGWERGYPPRPPLDLDAPRTGLLYVNVAELLDNAPGRPPADTPIEEWLRTTEAYDAVTGTWLQLLDAADPGNGHGIGTCA